jgi:hypothetical protein
MHHYMGPWPLNKDGSHRARTYGVKHPFWEALTDYYKANPHEHPAE